MGGLVGYSNGTVSQSYASGSVSGSERVGGLVGSNIGTVTDAYWDTQTTERTNGVGNGSSTGATGLTTAQMQDLASFRAHYAGFDFDTVWAPPNQVGQGGQGSGHYPELRSLSPVAVVAPASTTRVYGDANPGLLVSYGGLRAGDFVTGLGSLSTTATATSDVGSYAITASGATVTGKAGNSYRVVYLPGTLTVTQRPLTITASGQSRVYGDANPSLSYTTTSLGAGVALSGTLATVADAGSDVGSYGITQGSLTTAANPNYALTFQGANLTIGQRPVTVTAEAQSRLYGEANPSLSYTTTSLGAGAALSGSLATAATAASDVGSYAITQGSLTAAANPNYALTFQGADLTIGQRPLILTAEAQSRLYGEANPSLTYRVGGRGLVNGDALTGDLVTTADVRSTIGAYTIGQGTLAATSNYAVSYVGADLTVSARPITLTADAQSRVYGDGNPALTYQIGGRGLVNGDVLSGGLATVADARSNIGSYAIGQGSLATNGNYAVSYAGADLAVTARPLTLTADAQSRVYGDANPNLTYQVGGRGLVNGDALTGALATTADASSNVGSYGITQGSLTASANYAVTYQGADLTISQRPVTLTAEAQSRLYGEANPSLSYTTTSLGTGAVLSGTLATAATAASDVGSYAITQGSLTAAANPNYALTFQGADLTIGQRPLILTAEAQSRLYGEANPSLTYRVGGRGLVNGDALTGDLVTTADVRSTIGAYTIGQGTLAATSNYAVSYVGADLTVSARPITLTADAQSRVYGDGNPALTYQIGGRGLVNGDVLSGGLATVADARSNIGSYAIGQGSLATNGNYAVSYAGADLAVTARPLTLTADAQSRVYGEANPSLTYQIGGRGLISGDALTGALATTADVRSNVGSYGITQGSLAASANYAVSYVGADLAVNTRSLTLTADAQSRVYGDANPNLTYQVGGRGLVNGDALTGALATTADASSNVGSYGITQGSLTASANYAVTYQGADLTISQRPVTLTAEAQSRLYGEANPSLSYTTTSLGTGAVLSGTLATAATAASDVGSYAITQGSLTAAANPNYALTFQGADLTVGQRLLILTAEAQSRVYGEANPSLTYRVGGRGLVNGDTLTGALAKAADARSNVGSYGIGQGSLAASANYAVSYVGADLAVTARPLTLTADAQSRIYGDANPSLTYRVGGPGLVNGDALTGALATVADARSNVGAYAIGQGSLVASGNYTVSYVAADLAVTARPLTLMADAQSRVYGDANPALTYRVGGRGLVNGDALTGSLATTADARSNVGSYGIDRGSLAASANYAVSYAGADLAVTARPLILTAEAQSRIYGDANPSLTHTVGGRGLVNGDSLAGALVTAAEAGSAPGPYAINQGSLTATANYSLTYRGANLTITPSPASAPRALIAPAATAFASTVQRVSTVTQTPAAPWSAPASGLLQTSSQTIADPRFDKTVVCLAGGCFVVPPPAPTAAQPGSTIRPQASATAP